MIRFHVQFSGYCGDCKTQVTSPQFNTQCKEIENLKDSEKEVWKSWILSLFEVGAACNNARCSKRYVDLVTQENEEYYSINIKSIKFIASDILYGSNEEVRDPIRRFYLALCENDSNTVFELLHEEISLDILINGVSPLYIACKNNCYEIVELLLEHGATPTLRNDLSCLAAVVPEWATHDDHDKAPLDAVLANNNVDLLVLITEKITAQFAQSQ